MSVSVGDIFETFEQYDLAAPDQKLANKCKDICNRYELSADSFATKCEVLIMGKTDGDAGGITIGDLLSLEKRVKERWEAKQRKYIRGPRSAKKTPLRQRTPVEMNIDSLSSMDALSQALSVKVERAEDRFLTPIKETNKRRKIDTPSFESPSILASPPSATWQSRPNIGKTVCTFNSDLAPAGSGVKQTVEIPFKSRDLAADEDGKFRYMFDEPEERSESLNSMVAYLLRKLEEEIPNHPECKDIPEIEFSPVNFPSQKSTFIAGRVVCDADGEGRLNAKSILLEGDRVISAGNSVKVDVSNLEKFAFFPGQVVALEGNNSTGQCFVATRVHTPKSLSSKKPSLQEILQDTKSLASRPTSVMLAAGPFTTNDNLQYWPLNELLETVDTRQPDFLVLAGPFVDCTHKKVFLGEMDTTYEQQYENIIHTVERKLQGTRTRVLVVPSVADAHHVPVFPQPPCRAASATTVEFLPNPATFTINDITFGITNIDVLKHMVRQEISKGSTGKRLVRLADHILSQRSYYPLYPPAKGAPVDYQHTGMMRMETRPDVLITPGDLSYFAEKTPDGEGLCLNPGKLAKGSSGGTYAMITIHDFKEKPKSKGFDRKVKDRVRIDIVKI